MSKKFFKVPCYWQVQGYLTVEVEDNGNLEEDELIELAIEKAETIGKTCSLPEGSFVDDSFEVETNPTNIYPVKTISSRKILISEIEWDTDGVSVDDLPETITIADPTAEMVAAIGSDDYSDDYNVIADYLSDSYGWCVENFRVHFKPECKLIGEDGNIFNLMGIASRVLRENGMNHEAERMRELITHKAENYSEALAIISEYVDIV